MPGFKMTVLTGLVAVLGIVVTGGAAESGVNGQLTKTLEPKPIGTATENGALLVSMNYCSVVVNTQCQVSVMTSAPGSGPASAPGSGPGSSRSAAGSAPPQAASVDAAATEANSPVETNDAVQSVVPIPTRISVPASAGAESTEAAMSTETESPNQRTSEITNSSGTVTRPSRTGAPAVTSSALAAAAADIKALPGVAWGALILAVAMML
ncbi:hypothetical protein J3458_018900 [Metarhizium acridum]|uniref:uncharacterized protein n=1 Tax=Metarhizium acridum TaxID=92637 RepID=UPI001C6B0413|nr:hypothetical protein J3458_018900 [Metarhizium acridum]